jgi:PIN domain nuclease of toxin-antitoxin system
MILLDTNAILWLDNGAPMSDESRSAIRAEISVAGLLVSPISAWEIGMLATKGRIHLALPALAWFQRFLRVPGIRLTPLTAEAALHASTLPDGFHADPADRLLVATARELSVPIVTRDRKILAYAAAGHVQALPC